MPTWYLTCIGQGKLYKSVIDDVISGVREAFADEGLDEHVLVELKANWEKRLADSKAIQAKDQTFASTSGDQASTSRRNIRTNNVLPTSSTAVSLPKPGGIVQVDGPHDSSDEDDMDDEEGGGRGEDDDDREEDFNDEAGGGGGGGGHDSPSGEDEEPLNSGDDVSDEEEPNDLFETDNVVVCQYDKVGLVVDVEVYI